MYMGANLAYRMFIDILRPSESNRGFHVCLVPQRIIGRLKELRAKKDCDDGRVNGLAQTRRFDAVDKASPVRPQHRPSAAIMPALPGEVSVSGHLADSDRS